MSESPLISFIVPVYNSSPLIGSTVATIAETALSQGWAFEIVLVNDGSSDNSWQVIRDIASKNEQVKAINLLRNYGQHTAIYCGIKRSSGQYLVTLDDDLQNPPVEVIKLFEKIQEGFDAVFARFAVKQHSSYRRLGSRLIGLINTRIFNKPPDLILSNFRIFTRELADRMVSVRTIQPYITGLILMNGSRFANVETEHHPRPEGRSTYNLAKLFALSARLVFSYSTYPLKLVTGIGLAVAFCSLIVGLAAFLRYLVVGIPVPGWTTVVVLLSLLGGTIIVILGVIGVYLIRLFQTISIEDPYVIREEISNVKTTD